METTHNSQTENILFENSYELTEEYYKEISRKLVFGNPLFLAFNIFMAVWLSATLLSAALGASPNLPFLIAVGLWVALYYILVILRYFRTVKLSRERDIESFGEMDAPTASVGRVSHCVAESEGIRLKGSVSGKHETEFRNIELKKVKQSKHYFLLCSKARLVYIFKKGGFVKGTDEEFRAYLRTKGYKVR